MENHIIFKIKKSAPDSSNFIYRSDSSRLFKPIVDMREWDTVVENQQSLGSCTGVALTSAYELMVKMKTPEQYVELSDLFIYYNARMEEGTLDKDDGVFLQSALGALKKYGACQESLWKYDLEKWDDKPSDEAYEDGKKRTISKYEKLISIYYILEVLNNSKPVVFGMEVYDSFMYLDERINTVSLPSRKEKSRGGHAMCLVGYDLEKKLFLAKNSFGDDWGMNGYCWIPFDYIRQEGYDFWTFDIEQSPGEQNVLPQI